MQAVAALATPTQTQTQTGWILTVICNANSITVAFKKLRIHHMQCKCWAGQQALSLSSSILFPLYFYMFLIVMVERCCSTGHSSLSLCCCFALSRHRNRRLLATASSCRTFTFCVQFMTHMLTSICVYMYICVYITRLIPFLNYPLSAAADWSRVL